MTDIEDIRDYYRVNDSTYAVFTCPNCENDWGPSRDADPPQDENSLVKCTCGAILEVSGAWISVYSIEAELHD